MVAEGAGRAEGVVSMEEAVVAVTLLSLGAAEEEAAVVVVGVAAAAAAMMAVAMAAVATGVARRRGKQWPVGSCCTHYQSTSHC